MGYASSGIPNLERIGGVRYAEPYSNPIHNNPTSLHTAIPNPTTHIINLVMNMNIERLVEKYERDVKRILKASRIYPDMVTQFSIYFVTFKALKMFEGLGLMSSLGFQWELM
jgi:hypothetical protein